MFSLNAVKAGMSRFVRCTSTIALGVATSVAIGTCLASGTAMAQAGSAEWTKVLAAAKKEGKVFLYGGMPPAAGARLVEGWKKVYPDINMTYEFVPSGPMMARIDQERATKSDGGDIWLGGEIPWFKDRAREGALLKPVGPGSTGYPAKYIFDGTAVIVGVEPFVFAYNKGVGANTPKTYADLLKPEFKGKVAALDLVATSVVAWYEWVEKTHVPDFLAKLKASDTKLFASGVALAQSIGSGETIAGAGPTSMTIIKPLMAKGAPIDFVVPNPAFGFEFAAGAFAWSKRPNAALVVLDYLMSVEGQTVLYGSGDGASPRPNIPGSLPIANMQIYDAAQYTPEVVNKYRERWNRALK